MQATAAPKSNESGQSVATPLIAVCVATYRRNHLLTMLLERLVLLTPPAGFRLEVRIVDNDADGGARALVEQFAARDGAPPIHYAVEPRRSIAHARNRCVEHGPADRVVFIDDDEIPEPGWLDGLASALDEAQADVVVGAVAARYPDDAPGWLTQGRFLDKPAPTPPVSWNGTRTSNTIVRGSWFYERGFRFDERFGRSGGEDTDLFRRMSEAGAKLGGAPQALVTEDVQPVQLTFRWFWGRRWRVGVNFERQCRGRPGFGNAFLRLGKRVLFGTTRTIVWAIPALCGRSAPFVRGLGQLALAGGGLQGWLRPTSLEDSGGYDSTGCTPATSETEATTTRIAFLTNIVSPYRRPVLEALGRTAGWTLRVLVNAITEFDRSWHVATDGIDVVKTRGLSFRYKRVSREPIVFEQIQTRFVPTSLWRDLRRFGPDVVVSVELGPRSVIAASYCRLKNKPFVAWSYQSMSSITSGGRLRSLVRRFVLRRASAVIGMGSQSRRILEGYGVPPDRIVDAPNSCDDRALVARLESQEGRARAAELRARLSDDGRRRIAVVPARLIPLKGVTELIAAWRELPPQLRDRWTLVFVGDGPLRPHIEAHADYGIRQLPPVPPAEVADLYAMADLHVFASVGDVWGLVVNEAMLCGTPSLCSIHAACADDLVRDGVNGWTFDPVDREAATARLAEVLQRDDLAAVGAIAREDGQRYSTDRLADDIGRAIRLAQRHPPIGRDLR